MAPGTAPIAACQVLSSRSLGRSHAGSTHSLNLTAIWQALRWVSPSHLPHDSPGWGLGVSLSRMVPGLG